MGRDITLAFLSKVVTQKLGMQVSHEPHFCLLREVVNFSGGARGRPSREVLDNPCQEHFMLFQIGLLREYLEFEFRNPSLPFPYDVERIIDDFVLFCMLIGNDFLPGKLSCQCCGPLRNCRLPVLTNA